MHVDIYIYIYIYMLIYVDVFFRTMGYMADKSIISNQIYMYNNYNVHYSLSLSISNMIL